MFVVKPRITLFVCVLIVLMDLALAQFDLDAERRRSVLYTATALALLPGIARRSFWIMLICPLIVGAAYFHIAESVAYSKMFSVERLVGQDITLYGTVYSVTANAAKTRQYIFIDIGAVVYPMGLQHRGRVLLRMRNAADVKERDCVVVRGNLSVPASPKYAWDFDAVKFLRRYGAVAEMHPAEIAFIPWKHNELSFDAMFASLRTRISTVHADALGKRYGNLLTSMVIGNRNVEVDESISAPFRNLGLSHMLAASGFNLSVVVAATWFALRGIVRHRVWIHVCAGAMMLFYTGLAGLSPSIERAAIMCAAMLVAKSFMRTPYMPAVLMLTLAATVLIDPFALSDIGLQLSYAATAALICTGKFVGSVVTNVRTTVLRYLVEAVCSCTTAILAVMPLQLYYFWQIGLLTLPANAVISPAIPLLTIEGFVTSGLACMNMAGLASALDQLIGVVVRFVMCVIDWLNGFGWAVLTTGPPEVWLIVLYYIALLWFLPCRHLNFRAVSGFLAVMAMTWMIIWRPPLPLLTVIRTRGATVLIDSDRHALVIGDASALSVRRCLGYFGATATTTANEPSGATARLQWEVKDGRVKVMIRKDRRVLNFPTEVKTKRMDSSVKIYSN